MRHAGAWLLTAGILMSAGGLQGCVSAPSKAGVRGIVWQPDAVSLRPEGRWEKLSAREVLLQWSQVNGRTLVEFGPDAKDGEHIDLTALSKAPWARQVIVGLAGDTDEARARQNVTELAVASRRLAAEPFPFTVSGWYFPVELDATWRDVGEYRRALMQLPRPLWVSVYDNANLGPQALIDQIRRAVPSDVGVFFQDGVGVYARTPEVAQIYIKALRRALGSSRVRVIAEAFRAVPGGYRAATGAELAAQIEAYRGNKIYLFDGPHYVTDALINDLVRRLNTRPNISSSGDR